MSRTNYEAVSDYFGHWLHRAQCLAFDRFFRSNRVSNRVSHIVAALLPKIPWRGPGAGLCALACEGVVRQTHYPRQPADVKASKVGILPRKKIQSSPTCGNLCRRGVGVFDAPTGGGACEGLLCQTHHPRITRTRKLLRTGRNATTEAAEPASLQDRSRGAGLAPRPKPRSRPRSDRSRGAGPLCGISTGLRQQEHM